MESEKQLVGITQTKTEIVYLFHIRFHVFMLAPVTYSINIVYKMKL